MKGELHRAVELSDGQVAGLDAIWEVAPQDQRVSRAGRVDGVEGPRFPAGAAGEALQLLYFERCGKLIGERRLQRFGELPGSQHLRHRCMQSRRAGRLQTYTRRETHAPG